MYKPTRADLTWAQMTLAMITEGGTWVFPIAQQIYTISHARKRIVFAAGPRNLEVEEKVTATFAAMGYTVDYPSLKA